MLANQDLAAPFAELVCSGLMKVQAAASPKQAVVAAVEAQPAAAAVAEEAAAAEVQAVAG